jgi:natural product precursor
MKKIGKLKLNQLSKSELEKREMNFLKGGGCYCGCYYQGQGGSQTVDNRNANVAGGLESCDCICLCYCPCTSGNEASGAANSLEHFTNETGIVQSA